MNISKISYAKHGLINIVIHFPAVIVTSFWGLLIAAIFDFQITTEPFGIVVMMFPMFIPPISCVLGIIRGAKNSKSDKNARLCLILSIIGIFIYAGVLAFCYWLGSIA